MRFGREYTFDGFHIHTGSILKKTNHYTINTPTVTVKNRDNGQKNTKKHKNTHDCLSLLLEAWIVTRVCDKNNIILMMFSLIFTVYND